MTGAVEESHRPGVGELRHIVAFGKNTLALAVHQIAHDASLDLAQSGLLRVGHGLHQAALVVAGFTAQEGAGHVSPITGLKHAGENIDDDKIVGFQRSATAAVRIAGLVTAGYDRIGRKAARVDTGGLNGRADAFAGERAAIVDQAPTLDGGFAQHLFGRSETDGRTAVACPDRLGFIIGFDLTFGEDRSLDDV